MSEDQTVIRIQTANNFKVDVSWLRYEGKYRSYHKGKINDGPYILSLNNIYPEKLKFGNLRFRKRRDYFLIEADNYSRGYGTLEIRLYLNSNPDSEKVNENMFRLEFRHKIDPISSKIYHETTSK